MVSDPHTEEGKFTFDGLPSVRYCNIGTAIYKGMINSVIVEVHNYSSYMATKKTM